MRWGRRNKSHPLVALLTANSPVFKIHASTKFKQATVVGANNRRLLKGTKY